MLYFDHSATTPLHPQVAELIHDINTSYFGNPSSIHRYGQKSRALIEKARRQVASLIGFLAGEIIFTSGGTEANNLILWNQLGADRPHVITTAIEHPAVSATMARLHKSGVPITTIKVEKQGIVDADAVISAIRPDTGLVTVILASNEIGTIQPLAEIATRLRNTNIRLHCDAVQVPGKIPLDVGQLGVDFLTISGHKFYGPKGVGALYRKQGIPLRPLIYGGGQEQNLRSGTENVSGIAGMGLAAELARRQLPETTWHLQELADVFCQAICEHLPSVRFNGDPANGLPGLVSLILPQITSDIAVVSLDLAGMAISNGSACSSGTVEPSPVLREIGLSEAENRRTIRASFGVDNTAEEVEQLATKLVDVVNHSK